MGEFIINWGLEEDLKDTYFIGYDVGKIADYSALSILQFENGMYTVRHLERLPLDMDYPSQVDYLFDLTQRRPLDRSIKKVVVDYTGVGSAVFDLCKQRGLRPLGIQITAGSRYHWVKNGTSTPEIARVPKRDLVGILQIKAQDRKLQVASGLKFGPTLVQEMKNFRVKINDKGHDSYDAREGEHDDLLLATAIALWVAENKPLPSNVHITYLRAGV